MNSRVGGGEVQENTEMKALKDAQFDQRYILKCQAYLSLHMYVYIPRFNFTDGWMDGWMSANSKMPSSNQRLT